jgi:hypothetical protein
VLQCHQHTLHYMMCRLGRISSIGAEVCETVWCGAGKWEWCGVEWCNVEWTVDQCGIMFFVLFFGGGAIIAEWRGAAQISMV